jgi:hypothetical protein
VEGQVAALLSGETASFLLGCTVVVEGRQLVLTEVPLGAGASEILQRVADRATVWPVGREYGDYGPRPLPPVADIRDDSSSRTGLRIVIDPRVGVSTEEALVWLRDIWPVTFEVEWTLPAPMAARLSSWDPGDGSGLAALAVHCARL